MTNILLIDATEELKPLADTLEEDGFRVEHVRADRALEPRDERPAVMLFNLLGLRPGNAFR